MRDSLWKEHILHLVNNAELIRRAGGLHAAAGDFRVGNISLEHGLVGYGLILRTIHGRPAVHSLSIMLVCAMSRD